MTGKLTIEIVQQEGDGRTPCAFCLLPFDLAPFMAGVRADNSEDVYLDGYVCPTCLEGGTARMVTELRNRAHGSRRAAEQFDRWADGPIDVPDHAASILRSADPRWSLNGR